MQIFRAMIVLSLLAATAAAGDGEYKLGPDSIRHEGVPKGSVTKSEWRSTIFPDTVRDWWIYAPAQYDGKKPRLRHGVPGRAGLRR